MMGSLTILAVRRGDSVPIEATVDRETCAWLERIAREQRAEVAEIAGSMLRELRIDDEAAEGS